MLETSLATFSGRTCGKFLPTSFKLHKYIARANSGNRSWPDFVVSERTLKHGENWSLAFSISNLPNVHEIATRELGTYEKVSNFVACDPLARFAAQVNARSFLTIQGLLSITNS